MMTICLDMDGTFVDLYNVPNWLERLRNEDATVYEEAKPLVNMERFNELIQQLADEGHEIHIISWFSKQASETFNAKVRQAKFDWLTTYDFYIDYHNVHLIAYGTNKQDVFTEKPMNAILIDDDSSVRSGWEIGTAYDPNREDLLVILEDLLDRE